MFPNYILLTTHEQLKSKTFNVLPPHANLGSNVAFQRIVLNPLDGKMNITTSAMTTTSGHWMTIFRTKTESPWLKSSSSELNITPASFKASLSISSSDFWMVARLIFSSIPTKRSHKPPTQWPTFVSHDSNRWFMRVQSCWNDGMVISCTWLIYYKSQDISNLQVLFLDTRHVLHQYITFHNIIKQYVTLCCWWFRQCCLSDIISNITEI